ncbi:MAG: TonB-dependent receptor, partial [Planctomycetota bacterium]
FLLVELTFWQRLVLSGGVRYDDNSAWGSENTLSGSVLYHLEETGTRFRANYGEGFRGPKPTELHDPWVGNADLTPESSVSVDLGVEQSFLDGALTAEVTAFELSTEDLIAYDPATFLLQNYDETRTRGLETAVAWWATKELLARTWWTFQDPVDLNAAAGEDDQLPGRPKWFGGADVSWREDTWSVGIHFQASGEYPATPRITPDGDARKDAGRKLLMGLRGRVDVTENAAVTARIENLFDDDWYDDTARPSGSGLGFYLGAEIRF